MAEHISTAHLRKLPEIKKVSKPTYSEFLVGPVERFDQRNEVFSRAVWDEEYMQQLRNVTPQLLLQLARPIIPHVAVLRGVGPQMRAVHAHRPHLQQPHLVRHTQQLQECLLDR